jgi:hypothetical protein
MKNKKKILDLTEKMVKKESAEKYSDNAFRICEANYDLWVEELKPVLCLAKKPFYPAVVDLLRRGGCEGISEGSIRSYFSIIRKGREDGK